MPSQDFRNIHTSTLRREYNYTDRGTRQTIFESNNTRSTMDAYQTPATEQESVFIPDTSEEQHAADQPSPDIEQQDAVDQEDDPAALIAAREEELRRIEKDGCKADWKYYDSSLDQETYRVMNSNPSYLPEQFLSHPQLANLSDILESVETIVLKDQNTLDKKKRAFTDLKDWILVALTRSVRQNDLDSTTILPRIAKFIDSSPENRQFLRRRGVRHWFVEELTYLYRKWSKGDLSCDPNRGLIQVNLRDKNGTDIRTTYQLNKEYQFFVSGSQYGDNGLVNGQRWYSREQMMRDGAHNAPVAGIAGTSGGGAYSVVLGLPDRSHGYADHDRGNVIWYEGTKHTQVAGSISKTVDTGKKRKTRSDEEDDQDIGGTKKEPTAIIKPTSATQTLLTSEQNHRPVRVIRTLQLRGNGGKFYRYDGLYQVVESQCTNTNTQEYWFKLQRVRGQGHPRFALYSS